MSEKVTEALAYAVALCKRLLRISPWRGDRPTQAEIDSIKQQVEDVWDRCEQALEEQKKDQSGD